jgi:hypothetical protein
MQGHRRKGSEIFGRDRNVTENHGVGGSIPPLDTILNVLIFLHFWQTRMTKLRLKKITVMLRSLSPSPS